MEQETGFYIAVPKTIAAKILREGYCCTRRRQVPANCNRSGAVRAYYRYWRSFPPILLQVTVPPGVNITSHKDGIKLDTRWHAACYLVIDDKENMIECPCCTPEWIGWYCNICMRQW